MPDVMHAGGEDDFIISDRARTFFEAMDAQAFAFTTTEVLIGRDLLSYLDHHIFRLHYRMDDIRCTQAFRDAARAAKLVIGLGRRGRALPTVESWGGKTQACRQVTTV